MLLSRSGVARAPPRPLNGTTLYRLMHTGFRHRRMIAAALVAVGSLPFLLMAIFVVSMFVLPSLYRAMFDWFVPTGVDAPDNWALAITRIAWSFVVFGSIGLAMSVFGWWLFRRSAAV